MLTQLQNELLEKEAMDILEHIEKGFSTRDIMASIYMNYFNDKELVQAEVVADLMLDSIHEFDEQFQKAQDDMDSYLEEFASQVEADKSIEERCQYWMQVISAISEAILALENEDNDYEDKVEHLNHLTIDEDEATDEYADYLKQQAMQVIKNSHILYYSLPQEIDTLDEYSQSEEFVVSIDHIEYRGIITMLAYVHIKNGDFDNLPQEIDVTQVCDMVCCETEKMNILSAYNKGDIVKTVAVFLLGVLSVVLITRFALSMSHFIITIAMFYGWLVAIGCGLALIFVIPIIYAITNELIQSGIHVIKVSINAIINRCLSVYHYIKDNIIGIATEIYEKIAGKEEITDEDVIMV